MSTTTPSTKPEVEPEAQSGDDQEQMERENQETNTGVNVEYSEVKEQDRWLPIANVARIMKTALPENAKIAKEAKECMQECVSEFISFITSEASEKCQQEKRKTVNGEDILFAMTSLGFENYAEALKIYLSKYRETQSQRSENQNRPGTSSGYNAGEASSGQTGRHNSTSGFPNTDGNNSMVPPNMETSEQGNTGYNYGSMVGQPQ